ncbi:hypothetical protein [Streptomyces sp. JJ36]|uniref:hypothetical protein n=1 Tax=Streptomyces sp. JJ36 TaxID=2736645 RepID=UPI001F1660EB|nr:hypothetical protein [Streptomyces sp. JJ36]MCF6521990.1 hypothetical protein [Streptomyces sp. JJ36]
MTSETSGDASADGARLIRSARADRALPRPARLALPRSLLTAAIAAEQAKPPAPGGAGRPRRFRLLRLPRLPSLLRRLR